MFLISRITSLELGCWWWMSSIVRKSEAKMITAYSIAPVAFAESWNKCETKQIRAFYFQFYLHCRFGSIYATIQNLLSSYFSAFHYVNVAIKSTLEKNLGWLKISNFCLQKAKYTAYFTCFSLTMLPYYIVPKFDCNSLLNSHQSKRKITITDIVSQKKTLFDAESFILKIFCLLMTSPAFNFAHFMTMNERAEKSSFS